MKDSNTFFRTHQSRPDYSTSLQLEIEQITQSLEYEKRESSYLEEQINLTQYELNALPKSSKSSIMLLKSQISVLEHKLGLEVTKLNNAKFSNKQLRSQINEYRLDKCAHRQSLNAISENLNKTCKETEEKIEANTKNEELDEEQREQIFRIRAKSANQRSVYDEKINSLNSIMKDFSGKQKLPVDEKVYVTQSIEIIRVLKAMAKFSECQTTDKKKYLEHYQRHIHSLESNFNTIKSATGISIIEDIVTSCLKSEEQNIQILRYLNDLNSEIDTLEEKQKNYLLKILTLEGSKSKGQLNLQEFNKLNTKNLEKLEFNIKHKKEKSEKFLQEIQISLPWLKKIYQKIQNFQFAGLKIDSQDLSSIEKLNQESARVLLGNIEDYLWTLVKVLNINLRSPLSDSKSKAEKSVISRTRPLLTEMLEEKDLFTETGFDEIRVPISVEEMKKKALALYHSRKSFVKSKPNTPDTNMHRKL